MRTHHILTLLEHKLIANGGKSRRLTALRKLAQRGLLTITGKTLERTFNGRRRPIYHYTVTDAGRQTAKETLELSEGKSNQ